MTSPELKLVDAAGTPVWRVGRAPDPWAWIDHQWAGNARWDDPFVSFRTIYAADSLFGCFVELLAYSRPDRNDDGSDLLSGITEDSEDAAEFPVPPAGAIQRTWLTGRMIGTAVLTGLYVDVRNSATIAALRPKLRWNQTWRGCACCSERATFGLSASGRSRVCRGRRSHSAVC